MALQDPIASKTSDEDWRNSVLTAAIVYGAAVTGISEVLSVDFHLNRPFLISAWLLVAAACWLVWRPRFMSARRPRPAREMWLLAPILLLTLVAAIAAPPNTWDSMTFHMARVAHWVQNQSVAFYPTNVTRQLYEGPWTEYAILQFQIVVGNDRLANIVQWFAMAGSLIAVSAIVRELGGTARQQSAAVIVCATLPEGILQATSTQTDYACAFWLLCLAYFLLRYRAAASRSTGLLCGLALGLAILTKPTALLFAVPIGIWLGWGFLRYQQIRILDLAAGLLAALAIVVPFVLQNLVLFGRPTGPDSALYVNAALSIPVLVENLVRNLALQLSIVPYHFDPAYQASAAVLHAVHLPLSDPRSTWQLGPAFSLPGLTTSEDLSGNLLHTILLAGATVGAVLALFQKRWRPETPIVFVVLSQLVLYSLVFRWQPWGSRLVLPVFVLASIPVGMTVARWPIRKVVLGLLLGASAPWLLMNWYAPLVGAESSMTTPRLTQYFRANPAAQGSMELAATRVKRAGCRRVLLRGGEDDWEYPLWVLLGPHVQIEDMARDNVSHRLAPAKGGRPCVVIDLGSPYGYATTSRRGVAAARH